jgi:hypothetical protein
VATPLILGKIVDFITGQQIVDTHDERVRQKIARFLVENKGYRREDIEPRREIALSVDGNRATARVDFVIKVEGKAFAIIIFGPGSLVSRERSALAAARLVECHEVPFTVVTNGRDAEALDTRSGKVIGEGLDVIPSKEEASERMRNLTFAGLPAKRLEKEQRILYVFDVLAKRECDESTCSLR